MKTTLHPYLSFKDNAREAMEFYRSVFGGELQLNTFKEFGFSPSPSEDDNVMHSMLEAGRGNIAFMAADTPSSMEYTPGAGFSLALSGDDEAELRGYFEKLCEGGTVMEHLDKAPWGALYGSCTDRFGVNWMVNVTTQDSAARS